MSPDATPNFEGSDRDVGRSLQRSDEPRPRIVLRRTWFSIAITWGGAVGLPVVFGIASALGMIDRGVELGATVVAIVGVVPLCFVLANPTVLDGDELRHGLWPNRRTVPLAKVTEFEVIDIRGTVSGSVGLRLARREDWLRTLRDARNRVRADELRRGREVGGGPTT
jgi:hypothetical protein